MLPLGWLEAPGPAMIGSGVCVDPTFLLKEIREWDLGERTIVDFRCL